MSVKIIRSFRLESFNEISPENITKCQESCLARFEKELNRDRLKKELVDYSYALVTEGIIGHNCTGLTTLKYPIRVKAFMGESGVGNVSDFIEVVNVEKTCFD